jgi:outer membrane protein TolC
MRLFAILLAVSGTAGLAAAQTNTVSTNGYSPVDSAVSPAPNETSAGPVRRLALDECIELALKNNLDLKIDRYNPQIARYQLNAAYGYYDPTLGISGQHDHDESGTQFTAGEGVVLASKTDDNAFQSSLGGTLPWGTTYLLQGNARDTYGTGPLGTGFENSSGSASMVLAQPLLKNFWIDAPRLNILVAKNRVKSSEQLLRQQIMETVTTLEQAYYRLIYFRTIVTVEQKAVELAERLVAENRKRLEVGSLAPLDLQSAESQAAQSRAAVLQAQVQLGTQERLLKRLITDHFLDWADVTIEPTAKLTAPAPILDLQQSWRKGLQNRPEMVQAKLDLERQGFVLKYDRNQLFPQLDVFGTLGANGSGKEFSDALYEVGNTDRPFYTYGGRISMPLSRASARNNYHADLATEKQLALSMKRLEETIMVQIDDDVGRIRAAYDQVKATQAAREYAEAALNAEQRKLESGKSTTYTVLQMQRDLTARSGDEVLALNNYNNSLAQLSLDEASTLERLRIKLDVK